MARENTRRALFQAHRWSAVALGFVGLVVFFTGTVAVFEHELVGWAARQPTEASLEAFAQDGTLDRVVATIEALDPGWEGRLSLTAVEDGGLQVALFPKVAEGAVGTVHLLRLNADGEVAHRADGPIRDTFRTETPAQTLGGFFVDVHTSLLTRHKLGTIVGGFAALALTLLVATGLYVVWPTLAKRALARPRTRNIRLFLSDLHGQLGIWASPFVMLLGLTGAVFGLASTVLLPVLALVSFGGDISAVQEELKRKIDFGASAIVAPMGPMVVDASSRNGLPVERVFRSRRDEGGPLLVEISTKNPGWAMSRRTLLYDGHSGAFVREVGSVGQVPNAGGKALLLTRALHYGDLAGFGTKALWFLAGLVGSAVAAGGLALWSARTRGRIAGGLAAASAALPLATGLTIDVWGAATAAGASTEMPMTIAFFGTLVVCGGLGAARPIERLFAGIFAATAIVLAAAPIAGWVATGQAPSTPMVYAVDLMFALAALSFGALAAGAWLVTTDTKDSTPQVRRVVGAGRFAGRFLAASVLGVCATILIVLLSPRGPGGVEHFLLPAVFFPVLWLGACGLLLVARRPAVTWGALGVTAVLVGTLAVWGT